jgi:hypothetical protein
MKEIDRRSVVAGILCGAAVASLGLSMLPRLPTRSRSRPLRRVSPSHSISSRTHASPFMSGRAVGAAAATGAATGAEGGAFAAGTGGSVRSLAGDQARAMPKWAEAKTCAFRASLEYSATSKQFDSDCSFGRTVKWR